MRDAISEHESADPTLHTMSGQRRLVVADDDPDVQEFVQLALQLEGRFVVEGVAGTASEALGLLRTLQPDFALVDLHLPGLESAPLIREACAAAPKCRVVAYTGSSDAATAVLVRRAGGAGVIAKGSRSVRELTEALLQIETEDRDLDVHPQERG